ncbi:MAG: tRNA pseudouridine(13) synthase TruD [Acidilobaceae archaeon]|nr:tRNA pseudouridine(13) synthase TruD [Acidilobaceae archaeon]
MSSELLIGLEARLHQLRRPRAVLRLPSGFRVVELKGDWLGRGDLGIYFLRKVGVSTEEAMRRLSALLPKASYAGMKDARSVSYQYFSAASSLPFVDLGEVKAWRVGSGGKVKRGSHGGNLFRITLESEEPALLEENLRAVSSFPAFYGPQRFGARLSTHLYGLAASREDPSAMARELSRGLSWERRLLGEAREKKDPWILLRRAGRIYREALQAYIFNRALSKAIASGAERFAEGELELGACRRDLRLPAVRLPHEGLKGSAWADLVEEVLKEEGMTRRDLRGLKGERRALLYPAQLRSVAGGARSVTFTLCLPPSAYATIYLREVAELTILSQS